MSDGLSLEEGFVDATNGSQKAIARITTNFGPCLALRSLFTLVLMHWKPCVFNTVKDSLMLTPDFREFAALLKSNEVESLVVGGHARDCYDSSSRIRRIVPVS
jgi:hypothetical protein